MTVDLIQAIDTAFGPEGMDRVIAEREKATRRIYAERLRPGRSLAERAKLLAEQRAEEGYMAEVKRLPDGALLLIENHCPICVAAKACQGFCRSELKPVPRRARSRGAASSARSTSSPARGAAPIALLAGKAPKWP